MNENPLYTLVTPADVDEIRDMGSNHDTLSWYFGNKALAIWESVKATKNLIVTDNHPYAEEVADQILAIGQSQVIVFVADISGKAQVTVRKYYTLCQFYGPEMQERYAILPMSHFEQARQFPDYAEDILDIDLLLCDSNGGKPVPLRVLQALFRSVDQIPEMLEQLDETQSIEDVLALADIEEDDQQVSANENDVPPLVYHFLRNIDKIAAYIQRAVDRWDIPAERKAGIVSHVQELHRLIMECSVMEPVDN